MIKKILCLTLALVLAFSCTATAFAGSDELLKNANHFTGSVAGTNFDVYWDITWLIRGDNTVYYNELAKMCTVFASSCSYTEAQDGMTGNLRTYGTAVLEDMGFTDTLKLEVTDEYGTKGTDLTDTANVTIGHSKEKYNGKYYEIIAVGIRETCTSNDILNDLDFGADSTTYDALTGSHPDWVNRKNHKGFEVDAIRVCNFVDQYVEQYVDPSAKKIILITGYSKGATVANLLATHFENDEDHADYKSFAYCISPCNNTEASQEVADSYRTIFNINNADDIVGIMPFKEWGYRKYGRTLSFSIKNSDEAKAAYLANTGNEYEENSLVDDGVKFANVANSRSDFYEIDKSGNSSLYEYSDLLTKGTEKEANSAKDNATAILTEEGLIDWVEINVEKSKSPLPHVDTVIYFRPAYILKALPVILSKVSDIDFSDVDSLLNVNWMELINSIKLPPNYITDYIGQLLPDFKSVMPAHLSPSGYVCACQTFGFSADDFIDPSDTGSIFSEGSSSTIIALGACIVAAICAVIVVTQKKKASEKA